MADKTRHLTMHRTEDLLHPGDVFYLQSIQRLETWENQKLGTPVAYLVMGFNGAYMQALTLEPGKKAESGFILPKDIPSPGEFIRLLTLKHFSPALRRETLDAITDMLSTHVPNLQAAIQSGWQVLADLPDSLQVSSHTEHPVLVRSWADLQADGTVHAGFNLHPYGLGLIPEEFIAARNAEGKPTGYNKEGRGLSLTAHDADRLDAFLKTAGLTGKSFRSRIEHPITGGSTRNPNATDDFVAWIQDSKAVPGTPTHINRFKTFAEAEAACAAVMANTQSFPLRPTEPSA